MNRPIALGSQRAVRFLGPEAIRVLADRSGELAAMATAPPQTALARGGDEEIGSSGIGGLRVDVASSAPKGRGCGKDKNKKKSVDSSTK